jgi:hypothetical protein
MKHMKQKHAAAAAALALLAVLAAGLVNCATLGAGRGTGPDSPGAEESYGSDETAGTAKSAKTAGGTAGTAKSAGGNAGGTAGGTAKTAKSAKTAGAKAPAEGKGKSPQAAAPRKNAEQAGPANTDAERVAAAIEQGDCAALYEYTQKPGADKALAAQAQNTIKRYAALASNTGAYRTGRMDPRVRKVPPKLTEGVFVEPERDLPAVVAALVTGVSDQFLKAKILHDWICDNIAYDAAMYFSGRITGQDYASVLKKKKAVCSGYTNLMNKMCELGGVRSIGIEGYSKGFGYRGTIGPDTDHAWNAVNIGNKWYLIDVTWDAGPLERRTFIKRYSTEWLFLDSRRFLYSHLPEDEAYQFYAPALTPEDFMREAYIPGKFFQYGLSLKTEKPEYHNTVGEGGFAFDLGASNSGAVLTNALRTPQQRDIDGAAWQERKGGALTFEFDVPDTNEYKGHIFARRDEEKIEDRIDIGTYEEDWLPRAEALFVKGSPKESQITEKELAYFKASFYKVPDNGSYYFIEDQFDAPRNNAALKIQKLLEVPQTSEPVLDFNLRAAPPYQGFGAGALKYPQTFSTYNQLGNTRLISPKAGALKAGGEETFVISSTDYGAFAVIINGQWNHFAKNPKTGFFELALAVPPGITSLTISGSSGKGGAYWGLVRYTVRP